ncbi:MAG: response regulator [bacterium]|nr:response regulator [bacterium]
MQPREVVNPADNLIFVVDDDDAFRALMHEYLELLGYQVCAFALAEELLAKMGSGSRMPALVLSDTHMPRMTGLQLAQDIRKSHPDLPIILMSAFGEPESEGAAIGQGVSAYLEKPFQLPTIAALVQSLLGSEQST